MYFCMSVLVLIVFSIMDRGMPLMCSFIHNVHACMFKLAVTCMATVLTSSTCVYWWVGEPAAESSLQMFEVDQ